MTPPRFLLDTDIVSFALRGRRDVMNSIAQKEPSELGISAITAGELERGLARNVGSSLRPKVEALYGRVEVAPYDLKAARYYGRVDAALRSAGSPIGSEDTMIAAHALSLGATLVTHNRRHFERVEGLQLEDWSQASALR